MIIFALMGLNRLNNIKARPSLVQTVIVRLGLGLTRYGPDETPRSPGSARVGLAVAKVQARQPVWPTDSRKCGATHAPHKARFDSARLGSLSIRIWRQK